MKKRVWIPLLGSAAFLSLKTLKANKKAPSLSSKALQSLIDYYVSFPDPREAKAYKQALLTSKKEYQLPSYAKALGYGYAQGASSTIELPAPKPSSTLTIFYIHGGAYWLQPMPPHYTFLKEIAKKTNARVILPIYPKAPAFHVEDVYRMLLDTYEKLLDTLSEHQRVVMMGDSAGGALVLGLLQVVRDHGLRLPEKAVLLSPWVDASNTNPEMHDIEENDPLLTVDGLAFQAAVYANGFSTSDPLISPIYGDYREFPPLVMFVGTYDCLSADQRLFTEKAKKHKWPLTTIVYEKMMHVFPFLPTPEGKKARDEICNLLLKE